MKTDLCGMLAFLSKYVFIYIGIYAVTEHLSMRGYTHGVNHLKLFVVLTTSSVSAGVRSV